MAFVFLGTPAGGAGASDPPAPTVFEWRSEVNGAFSSGEFIRYTITYGFLPAGFATLEVRPVEVVRGRPAFHIVSEAKTNKGLDVIYRVRDRNESWMDVGSLCSLQFRQDIREGGYARRGETLFDPANHRFVYTKWRKGTESVHEGESPAFVQDILSSLYFVRTRSLVPGQSHTLDAHSGKENWPLIVHVLNRGEVTVPAGTFPCLRLEPVLAGEGLFQAKGKLEVWVTDDDRHVPVLLRSRVAVGAFDAEMTEYRPGVPLGPATK